MDALFFGVSLIAAYIIYVNVNWSSRDFCDFSLNSIYRENVGFHGLMFAGPRCYKS